MWTLDTQTLLDILGYIKQGEEFGFTQAMDAGIGNMSSVSFYPHKGVRIQFLESFWLSNPCPYLVRNPSSGYINLMMIIIHPIHHEKIF
jgi:hypothetical protein